MDISLNAPAAIQALYDEVLQLRADVVESANPILARFEHEASRLDPALTNLAYYLAVRQRDLRPMQRELMQRGLSSLGRLESRVLPTLDAVLGALAALISRPAPFPPPDEETFFAGERRLEAATVATFGPRPANRNTLSLIHI